MNDDALLAALGERISSLAAELIDIRRDFHAHPELSREEVRTTQTVARRLDAAGVGVRLLPGTGLLADIGAPDAEHRVALRADMDALPVRERTGLDYASRTAGVCHACGHDVHVVAAARRAARAQGVRAGADRARPRRCAASSRPPRRSSPAGRTTPSPRGRSTAWTPCSPCTATPASTSARSGCARAR